MSGGAAKSIMKVINAPVDLVTGGAKAVGGAIGIGGGGGGGGGSPAPAPKPIVSTPIGATAAQSGMGEGAVGTEGRIKRRTQTVFTSPLGISSMANLARKTLLGQ